MFVLLTTPAAETDPTKTIQQVTQLYIKKVEVKLYDKQKYQYLNIHGVSPPVSILLRRRSHGHRTSAKNTHPTRRIQSMPSNGYVHVNGMYDYITGLKYKLYFFGMSCDLYILTF